MIITKEKGVDIQSTVESQKSRLGARSNAMIFKMFTGGLYSDPIGSVIREITSNCFDSHVEAGKNNPQNPVIVELKKETSGHFIYFRDNGIGMSPNRVNDIFTVYFETTKDNTNDEIGGFGLGGKTPLAYTSSFFIITRFDGIEYVYNMYEGEEQPEYDLLSQTSTDLPNGTDVKIPIKESDITEFERKTLRQLYYFENIIFKGYSNYSLVTNDYKITKAKNFLFRGNEYSSSMHVCYGKVAYPIDFEAMGIQDWNKYNIPVGVRIEIGELDGTGVTPSREALKYSPANIKIIKAKMDAAHNEVKDMLVKQYENVVTLKDYYRVTTNFGTLYIDNDRTIRLDNVIDKKDIVFKKFKFNDIKVPSVEYILNHFYNLKVYGKPYPTRTTWDLDLSRIKKYDNIYYVNDEFDRKVIKQSYLKTLSSYNNFQLVTRKDLNDPQIMEDLFFNLDVTTKKYDSNKNEFYIEWNLPRKKAEKLIHTMSNELHELFKEFAAGNYDDVIVPEDFIEERKHGSKLSSVTLKTTIQIKNTNGHRYKVTFEQLNNHNGRIYYGFNDDSHMLDSAYSFQRSFSDKFANEYKIERNENSQGTLFISISKQNEKYMKMLKKRAFHVNDFYRTYATRKVDEIIQSKQIDVLNKIFYDVCYLFGKYKFKFINEEIYDSYNKISEYLDKSKKYNISDWSMDLIKSHLGVDFENVKNHKFEFQKELDQLVIVSDKNKSKLKWFNFSYYNLNLFDESESEFVDMVKLVFEK